jgi:hypothetical protein
MLSILLFVIGISLTKSTILQGSATILDDNSVTVEIDTETNLVDITLEGTIDVWNGFGFGDDVMQNTYCIIMDYHFSTKDPLVFPVKLGKHRPGAKNSKSFLTVLSDTQDGSTRTVKIQRPIKASSFNFPTKETSMDIISAIGPASDYFFSPRHSFNDRDDKKLRLRAVAEPTEEPTERPTTRPTTRPTRKPTSRPNPRTGERPTTCYEGFECFDNIGHGRGPKNAYKSYKTFFEKYCCRACDGDDKCQSWTWEFKKNGCFLFDKKLDERSWKKCSICSSGNKLDD